MPDGWNLAHTYTALPQIFYSHQIPKAAERPQMVVFNHALAQSLGLNPDGLKNMAEVFSGSALPDGANPISQAYAGYQFGHFAMLGDGRAVLLGEQVTPDGGRFDIQLKGSGRTPYSRGGDGLAALGPMLREYIISEAMFFLGIPTTRSLAVVSTGEEVIRESVLQGAVLTRVAASHIRVGTFDFASAFGSEQDVRSLADYSIRRHFPWVEDHDNPYLSFLREVSWLQASLIAQWQLAGFIHGVMNTDNIAISGQTIDYGPCAFMDTYNPDTVFSSIDTSGRYAYKNQPAIGAWNLAHLAQSLFGLLSGDKDKAVALAQAELTNYWAHYDQCWLSGMRAKLGLITEEADDSLLIAQLLQLMSEHQLDYTNTLRALCFADQKTPPFFEIPQFAAWLESWQARLRRQNQSPASAMEGMKGHNPAVIPRNHRVEEALSAAEQGDLSVMENLLEALRNPFEDHEEYSAPAKATSCPYKTFCGT